MEACLVLARDRGAETVGIHTVRFMRAACRIYEAMNFGRCPEYDVRVSEMLGLGNGLEEVFIIAYRRDVATK